MINANALTRQTRAPVLPKAISLREQSTSLGNPKFLSQDINILPCQKRVEIIISPGRDKTG